jgi:hypothetical protein
MPSLTPKDRKAIGTGIDKTLVAMGHITKVVVRHPAGGTTGGDAGANIRGRGGFSVPPSTNPAYTRLFVDLLKVLHDIECELIKDGKATVPAKKKKKKKD